MSYPTYTTKTNEFFIHHPADGKKNFLFYRCIRENCSSKNNTPQRICIQSEYPRELLESLFKMTDLHTSVSFIKNYFGIDIIEVSASYYIALDIKLAIERAIEITMYPKLSVSDANTIIEQLGLSRYVYYIEGHESGACLVVFEKKRYHHDIDAQKVFRDMVNGLERSGKSSTKTIQIRMQEQLQLLAIEARIKELKTIKSVFEQAILLQRNSLHEQTQLKLTNDEIEQLEQRMREFEQAIRLN